MKNRWTAVRVSMGTCVLTACGLLALMRAPAAAQEYRIPQGWFPQLTTITDFGTVKFHGAIEIDIEAYQIKITGTGRGIGGREDNGTFAWKKVGGDVACQTYATWKTIGSFATRKAGIMMRAGLAPDDPYVGVMTSDPNVVALQYRMVKGGETAEIRSPIPGPQSFTLERTGNQYRFVMEGWDNRWHPIATITVPLPDSVYVGFAMCSADPYVRETITFANMTLYLKGSVPESGRVLESSLQTIDIQSGIPSFLRFAREHIEAPNWDPNGATLMYNAGGRLYSIPVTGGTPKEIALGKKVRCNNDHGFSPDGSTIAFSHDDPDGISRIYLAPAKGGKPRLVTKAGPSYWHGWSPDGTTLAYCAQRKGEFDIYTIPVGGGKETRLTDAPGLDDGPEYSPDGKTIYFNSIRSGQMKIWKMNADGTNQEQVTPNDEYADWFPHPSPDGKYIVFLSYQKSVEGHPANQDVVLRLMPTGGGDVKTLTHVHGGQGTLNVPSWSPNSKEIAFVTYRMIPR